jgi:hypothetical protein
MNVSFVVTINADDAAPLDASGLATDIIDALESDGLVVVSVNPWDRPSVQAPALPVKPI